MNICSVDRIWIKKEKKEEKTKGGIILPSGITNDERTDGSKIFGEVVVLGDTVQDKIGNLKVGDSVLFDVNHPQVIKLDGQEYYVLVYNHILAYEPATTRDK